MKGGNIVYKKRFFPVEKKTLNSNCAKKLVKNWKKCQGLLFKRLILTNTFFNYCKFHKSTAFGLFLIVFFADLRQHDFLNLIKRNWKFRLHLESIWPLAIWIRLKIISICRIFNQVLCDTSNGEKKIVSSASQHDTYLNQSMNRQLMEKWNPDTQQKCLFYNVQQMLMKTQKAELCLVRFQYFDLQSSIYNGSELI